MAKSYILPYAEHSWARIHPFAIGTASSNRDPNVDNDIPAVRKLRAEVVLTPWLFLTICLTILLISFWRQ